MLESVFLLNVEVLMISPVKGLTSFLSEMNPFFKNWFTLSMLRPSSLSIHA